MYNSANQVCTYLYSLTNNESKYSLISELHEKWEDKEFVVEFDFLGKDSIRYQNWVAVNKRVYKNLKIFVKDKEPGDDLFDRLNTSKMNEYLGMIIFCNVINFENQSPK